jgi:hypothetical protein
MAKTRVKARNSAGPSEWKQTPTGPRLDVGDITMMVVPTADTNPRFRGVALVGKVSYRPIVQVPPENSELAARQELQTAVHKWLASHLAKVSTPVVNADLSSPAEAGDVGPQSPS